MSNRYILEKAITETINSSESPDLLSLPDHLQKIKSLVQGDNNADIDDMAPLIESDPGFTAFLMHTANSTMYRGHRPLITNVRDACSLIGFRDVGNLAIMYSTKIKHNVRNGPRLAIKMIKRNWEQTQKTFEKAEELAKKKERDGLLKLNVSELRTFTSLYFASNLVVFFHAIKLMEDGLELEEEDIKDTYNKMRPVILRCILEFIGYSLEEARILVAGETGEMTYLDIVHYVIAKKDKKMVHKSVLNRLVNINLFSSSPK